MVTQMDDLHSQKSSVLLRYQRNFDYGTDEWWEIQGILLYRRWCNKHGDAVGKQMYDQWQALNLQRVTFDKWYGDQLELELRLEE